ncbi:MAG: hypothetical protein KC418_04045 [Anaerolineales bacterium]|nr:hypothetical protein [Anaerolineales bacterium]MCB8953387.1 hypothetical protein [Ardenticatenales bacterium]
MKRQDVTRHPLLSSRQLRRRNQGKLLWIILLCAGLGGYDYFTRALGSRWYWIWVAVAAALGLWVYYALLLSRVSVQVHPNYIRLQGALRGFNISYGRVLTVTSSSLSQHYKLAEMRREDRRLLEPHWGRICLLVELNQYPPGLRRQGHWWLPRSCFSKRQSGLLLLVEDWMGLSREMEAARANWLRQRGGQLRTRDQRTLVARIMDEYVP